MYQKTGDYHFLEALLRSEQIAGTAPGAPGSPMLTSATGGNGQVTLQWAPPTADGGSAVTGYDLYRGTASDGEAFVTRLGKGIQLGWSRPASDGGSAISA
jgi:hypothetical protein